MRIHNMAIAVGLLATSLFAEKPPANADSVRGLVLTRTPNGSRSLVTETRGLVYATQPPAAEGDVMYCLAVGGPNLFDRYAPRAVQNKIASSRFNRVFQVSRP